MISYRIGVVHDDTDRASYTIDPHESATDAKTPTTQAIETLLQALDPNAVVTITANGVHGVYVNTLRRNLPERQEF